MKHFGAFAAAGLMAATCPAVSHASIMVDIVETGGDVVASYSGSLTDDDLIYEGGDNFIDSTRLSGTTVRIGNPFTNLGWSGFTGPANWGSNSYAPFASSKTGSFFVLELGIYGSPRVFVPKNYIFGSSLNGTATFAGETFASIGLEAGQYVYTSPGGQTITINIGDVSAVPEPASWALVIAGFGLVGATMRCARRQLGRGPLVLGERRLLLVPIRSREDSHESRS